MADPLAAIDEMNARHRTRDLRSLSDVALVAYHDRIERAVAETPDEDREIMALFDEHELTATEAEMLRRGIHPKRTPPPSTRWRIVRVAADHHPAAGD